MGLGGSGTNDGGAGLLAALGATSDGRLDGGVGHDLESVDRRSISARPGSGSPGVRLVAATDVDAPLTGLFGATKTFGAQKGIAEEDLPGVDGILEGFARATDHRVSLEPGAGAAGGLGFALLAARRRHGRPASSW